MNLTNFPMRFCHWVKQIFKKMSNCTELGLSIAYITYFGYADNASGTNFSLGTPLSTSKYIGFLSLPSTASPPSASDYTGLWVALYGNIVLQSNVTQETTTLVALTTLSTVDLPIGIWQIGNTIKMKYTFYGDLIEPNKAVTLLFMGANPLGYLPNFNYAGADTTIQRIVIDAEITKNATSGAIAICSVKYINNTGVMLYEKGNVGNLTITDTDTLASTIISKGQSTNAASSIYIESATVILSK